MSKKRIKDGSLYYRQKDILRPLGGVFMIVGVVWFYVGLSMASYYIPCIIVPLGLVFFFVGGSKHISDNDMLEQSNRAMEGYDSAVTDAPYFYRAVLKQPADVTCEAYAFGETARYFKRGKNGTVVSDVLTRSHAFFTKDGILVASRTLSLANLHPETGDGITDGYWELPYATIRSASMEEHSTSVTLTNTGKAATVRWYELVICSESGECLRLPVKNDMDVSTLCDEINRCIPQKE